LLHKSRISKFQCAAILCHRPHDVFGSSCLYRSFDLERDCHARSDNYRRQKLSPLVDRINDRYGRCAIGFGLFPPDVRAFKGHAAFHRVPEF
jgi:hypothetical protein